MHVGRRRLRKAYRQAPFTLPHIRHTPKQRQFTNSHVDKATTEVHRTKHESTEVVPRARFPIGYRVAGPLLPQGAALPLHSGSYPLYSRERSAGKARMRAGDDCLEHFDKPLFSLHTRGPLLPQGVKPSRSRRGWNHPAPAGVGTILHPQGLKTILLPQGLKPSYSRRG